MRSAHPFGLALVAALALGGCQAQPGGDADGPGSGRFTAIGADEPVHATGTEPFWSVTVTPTTLTYKTPENPDGTAVPARRNPGNNGLGVSATLDGRQVDLAITLAPCSDGMSDRTYPFTVTFVIGEEMRTGCAWTDTKPPKGGPA